MTQKIVFDLLIILFAGFAAGVVCRALRAPLLVGYIIVGAMLGDGCLGLIVADRGHEIELFAEAGALLLLFSVGLEFSLEELSKLRRHIFLGGSAQMVLVAVPLTLTACWFGIGIEAALLLGVAGALSSTVLVFKALSEYGQLTLPAGRRAIGILLFQDIALVPILLLVPLLTGQNQSRDASDYAYFVINSFILIAMIPLLRTALQRWIAPWLSAMRSPELIVLFVISLIGMLTLAAYLAGLPAPLGAFAAGLVLNGNRISGQIDALILSFREVFAVVFFVSLGVLFNPDIISQSPLVILIAFIGLLLVKSFAGTIAVRITGLQWRASIGSGIGLAQIGEFAFILGLSGLQAGLLTQKDYDYLLVFALGSLLLTPLMLKFGLRWSQADDVPGEK
ncbi:MAG: cation:proton antiporter, partial [Deltaproteobacteria bacterium]|nr:cation:proton antiporter [Deltaproteobacteria bacterium]